MSGEEQRYGIHAVWPLPDGSGVRVCCECRTQTKLVIDASEVTDGMHMALPEAAFTCDGCGTTHWFTLTPAGQVPDG